jgi:hypothetical protein
VQALQEIGYGLLLIVFVIFLPRGLAGFLIDRGILPREKYSVERSNLFGLHLVAR